MEILKIEKLTKTYPNGRGIHNIDITVSEGEIYGFLGPNGSGKTTTLKVIMGIINKNKGEITINGFNTETDFEKAIRFVGAMFESTVHYGNLTAYENMRQLSRYYPDIDKKRIDVLLEMVGLSKNRNEKTHKFSLGMRQRLAIAEAMYGEPKLLILDEPFNGLDIEGIVEIRKTIVKMAEQDKTAFLISSHMAAEMEKMCTHIGVIKDGIMLGNDGVENILELYPSLEDYFINKIN